ncbi:uncharacterized protein EURHEDRAFT_382215 [Aspergillus ruber CBS 135680]|uniref:Uncharacterized protein n=1 Tax=Aspergillus ruber (strain CBS 135680) TaxID=1388766 RepID=A0A017RZQ7_ASPRC|nr:uncharacterized protein EURHEDRAFT_382215 [Aspergillus ruber CBS 135680]EYE90157.1 hypothetical protein EURHEDRAFT_382215 [Aspergillus ruber CBS 135680]
MLQLAPSSFEAASCLFPTETLAHNERGFKSIALPSSANANSSKPLSRDVLLEAWTIVLRYYVGSDMICFGCIDDASEPKHAVCHGDIPAHASLDALHKFTAKSMGNSVQAQSVKDWIRLNDLFNTLVWSQSSSDSNLEDLQDTQCALPLLLSEAPTGL